MDNEKRIELTQSLLVAFSGGQRKSYKKGELIVYAGDEPTHVFYINSGIVKSYYITSHGNENLAFYHKQSDFFPAIGTFLARPSLLYYEALTASEIISIPRSKFLATLDRDPRLTKLALLDVTMKLDVYTERINNTQFRSSYERVAYSMLSLAKRFGVEEAGSLRIDAPLTHQMIADSVGLSRETVSRQIEHMVKEGAIGYKGRLLYVNDMDYLSQVIQ